MNDRKISYLIYCSSGLILSILIVLLFEAYPSTRFLSDGGVVFGVMCAILWHAVKNTD
jgi:uncharacterized membrane protein YagU involved in acid resistance